MKRHGYTEAGLLWFARVAAENSILGQWRKKPVVSGECE